MKYFYGITSGVLDGNGVLVDLFVASIIGVGVHVGGRDTSVGVDVGTMIVAGMVGYGYGLIPLSGLIKIASTTTITTAVANRTAMVSISQNEIFISVPPDVGITFKHF